MTGNEIQTSKLELKISKTETDICQIRKSKEGLDQLLNDANTSLSLHKNLIMTFINNNQSAIAGEIDATIKVNLNSIRQRNHEALQIFANYQQEKVERTKTLNFIMYVNSNRKKDIEHAIKYYNQLSSCLQKKINTKMIEMEKKVKDHDKLVESKDTEFIEKYIHHYPTRNNIELFTEKVQGDEILNKLLDIMKNEKLRYSENQNRIKDLIVQVSKSKRKKRGNYTTLIEDSFTKTYCNTTPYETMENSLSDEYDDNDNCNNLNTTLDSKFIQFPDKVHLRTISSQGMANKIKSIPKLDLKPIKFKYRYESSGFAIKQNDNKLKKKANELLDARSLKNLLQSDEYDDEGINKLKLDIKESQMHVIRLKEDLLYWKDGLRINTIQAAKLDDSIDEANMKIYRLDNLILELKHSIYQTGDQEILSGSDESDQ